ncbi:MAG: SDR family oxidoreductase [Myxococcota bacterium]
MANHLEGRVIVITGAGSGFGRLVAQKTAARGARIVASDVDQAGLDETVASLEAEGGEAIGVIADVTDRAAMHALAQAALDRFGAIDVILNNAGVMPLAFFNDHAAAAEAWDRCIDINLKGVLNGICAVHDAMLEQGRGHVVNVSSIYGNGPVPGAAVYGATKAAVRFISEALRQESQGRIKVTTIRPTGVPGTNLSSGMINPTALTGVLGAGADAFMEKIGKVFGEDPPAHLTDVDGIEYFALAPELLADQIVYAIDQPWGVSISDVTVRASGDGYML